MSFFFHVKPTFFSTPEESSASSNMILSDTLPVSNAMDTDTPATDDHTV